MNIEGTDAQRHLGADRSSQNDNMWQLYKALFFRRDSGEFKCSRQSYFRHRKSEETPSPVAIFTDNRLLDSYRKCQLWSLKTKPTFLFPSYFFFFSIPFSDHKRIKYLLSRCVFELVIWGLFSLMASESWILPEDLSLLVVLCNLMFPVFSLLELRPGSLHLKGSFSGLSEVSSGRKLKVVYVALLTAETLKLLCRCAHKLVVGREQEKRKWKQSRNSSVY